MRIKFGRLRSGIGSSLYNASSMRRKRIFYQQQQESLRRKLADSRESEKKNSE
jgi:hypothetical protein